MDFIVIFKVIQAAYPSATGKLLWVLLKPGDGELLTYVTSGQGEHYKRPNICVTVTSTYITSIFAASRFDLRFQLN